MESAFDPFLGGAQVFRPISAEQFLRRYEETDLDAKPVLRKAKTKRMGMKVRVIARARVKTKRVKIRKKLRMMDRRCWRKLRKKA